ncbi:MAG: type II toxin-antitoxin system RelE/ParE family toxin [Thaumarchaeota archaeon]|nr:type II toxin-antitoxin system RelE/ParE family toxin [Nitrososphaerota archaeon]
MTGKILYKSSVSRDLKHIDSKSKEMILGQIKSALADNPRSGEPLHREFQGLFKIRVGDYRVIYTAIGVDVLVLRIRHRSKVYS